MDARLEQEVLLWVYDLAFQELGLEFSRAHDFRRGIFRRRYGSLPFGPGPIGNVRAIDFVAHTVIEALDHRTSEPAARKVLPLQFKPGDLDGLDKVLVDSPLEFVVRGLIRDSAKWSPNPRDGVQIIDILAAIHLKWCNIWPFCRPTQDEPQG